MEWYSYGAFFLFVIFYFIYISPVLESYQILINVKDDFLMTILGYFLQCLHKNIYRVYSLDAPWWGISNKYPQHFYGKVRKNIPELSSNTPL